jgi:hypothetical protein
MIKIEVTGNSIPEVADKLLAIGHSLYSQTVVPIANGGTSAQTLEEVTGAKTLEELFTGVAEAAPAPLPTSPVEETASSSAEEKVSSGPTEATPPAGELNFDIDVAPHVLQVVKEKGKPVAQEILSQFGVEKASLLDPALWPELVQQLKDAL